MMRDAIAWPLAVLAAFSCTFAGIARADDLAENLSFPDTNAQQAAVEVVSESRSVDDIDEIVAVSIAGCSSVCAWSRNGTAFSGDPGVVQAGDTIRLRQTSNPGFDGLAVMTLNVGSGQHAWQVSTVGAPSNLSVVSGANQSARIGTDFAAPVVIRIADGNNNPVQGVDVSVGPDPGEPGATFGGNATATQPTDANGLVSFTATARDGQGGYNVPISAFGGGLPGSFALNNLRVSLNPNTTNIGIFQPVLLGESRNAQFALQNQGNTAATVTAITVDAPFSIAPGTCATIPAFGSCTVDVTFTPAESRPVTRTITVTSDSDTPVSTVSVSGTGQRELSQGAGSAPAATLLFPYFEVDLDDATGGANTRISWRDVGAASMLTHVTVWSDYGIPVVSFNVYLTGYDVATLDLRSLLVDGRVPRTASAGQDPTRTISPQGPYSQHINFASCNGQLPYPDPVLTPTFRADLQAALTGGPSAAQQNRCVGADHGDRIMRGYVTIDTVNNCTTRTVREPAYIANDITTQNALAGEYLMTAPVDGTALSAPAGSLQADEVGAIEPGDQTFYGTFTNFGAQDHREPLPTTWAVDAQAEGTEVIVWRDHKRGNIANFACGAAPAGFPLPAERAFTVDNEERVTEGNTAGFPLATQRVAVGSAALPSPLRPGWIYLGLGHAQNGANQNDPAAAQAHVSVLQRLDADTTSGGAGHPLDTGNDARHVHPN